MTNCCLGHDDIGKTLHPAYRTAKDDRLETVIVIQVNMQARSYQIMMVMLHMCDAAGQFARLVVINVSQVSDTVPAGLLVEVLRVEPCPNQVADGFRAVAVTVPGEKTLEIVDEFIIQCDRQSLHVGFLSQYCLAWLARHK